MKVTNIEKDKNDETYYGVYIVTLEPNWIQKLFGMKTQQKRYKRNGSYYVFGSGHVYIDTDGYELGNGSYIGTAIDAWRRKW